MPHEKTADECAADLLDHFRCLVHYWATVRNADGSPMSTRERLDGLVFSILVTIDGGSPLPAWRLAPAPHPDDRAFHEEEGDDWWPSNDADLAGEYAGQLHDLWCELDGRARTRTDG